MWSSFRPEDIWIESFLNQEYSLNVQYVKNVEDCDIMVCSVFGVADRTKNLLNICQQNNKKTVLISLENFNRFTWIKPFINQFTLSTGLNIIDGIENYIRIPYYVYANYENIYTSTKIENNKTKNICIVANKPVQFRKDFIDLIKKYSLDIDCFGQLCNNSKIPGGYSGKLNTISNYYFNFCPENTYSSGYVTEKTYHAIYAGCIPIYWGDISCDKNFYNLDKFLIINKDFSNAEEIILTYADLINNKKRLNEISSMDGFSKNKNEIISSQINLLKSFWEKYII